LLESPLADWRSLAQTYAELLLLPIAINVERDFAPRRERSDRGAHIGIALHGLAVDAGNQVARLESCFLGWAAADCLHHADSFSGILAIVGKQP
jgi:hypothetical protein